LKQKDFKILKVLDTKS